MLPGCASRDGPAGGGIGVLLDARAAMVSGTENPVDNPISEAKVELGRSLFYDERLSGNGTYSCGSCHQQALAFTDGLAHAVGSTGQHHSRSTMSLANVVYNASFGWDERRWSLEAQMEVPMYNEQPIEMGLKGRETEVLARFTRNSRDIERFRMAFPSEESPVTLANIIKAIASFERVLVSADSAFDRYLYKDDRSAMSPAAQTRRRALLLRSPSLQRMPRQRQSVGAHDVCRRDAFRSGGVLSRYRRRGPACQVSSPDASQYCRDRALHARRKHGTLKDVVQHYARGGRPRPEKSDRVRGFTISPEETDDLIAFLQSLTDDGFLTNPAFSNPHAAAPTGQK